MALPPVAPTERLVVGGLYRYVRNPIYLAVAATIIGQALALGQPILLPYAAAFVVAVAGWVVSALSVAAMALVVFLFASHGRWPILVFVIAFGMSNGMIVLLRATLVVDLYDRANYGAISGVLSSFVLGARAAAPLGAALIASASGGYTTLLVVLAVMATLAACAAAFGTKLEQAGSVANATRSLEDLASG